jgi:hypothetical protein
VRGLSTRTIELLKVSCDVSGSFRKFRTTSIYELSAKKLEWNLNRIVFDKGKQLEGEYVEQPLSEDASKKV